MAPGKTRGACFGAVMDHAEQHQHLRPRPVAQVHRVGEQGGILTQALVEARERIVLEERLVLR